MNFASLMDAEMFSVTSIIGLYVLMIVIIYEVDVANDDLRLGVVITSGVMLGWAALLFLTMAQKKRIMM